MKLTGEYRCRLLGTVVLLLGMNSPVLVADTAEDRLQRLEKEIEELRRMLGEQQQQLAEPVQLPAAAPAAAPVVVAPFAAEPGGVYIQYFISGEPFAEQPPTTLMPVAKGRFTEPDTLSFDPRDYDVPDSPLFSQYKDLVAYRYVGLLVEGDLAVREAGDYEFIVSPKPVREGGTGVSTRMTVQFQVGDRPVVEFEDEASWKPQRGAVHLEPGIHRLWLWAMVASDGFGPNPTDSHLKVAFKTPGDASPRSIRGLRPVKK